MASLEVKKLKTEIAKCSILLNIKLILSNLTNLRKQHFNNEAIDLTFLFSFFFQENDTIRFRVTLEDEVPAGQQPNIVGVDAYVIVLDENDNPPHFLGVPYEAVAEEDTPVGSTILPGIRVVDHDLLGEIIDLTCVPQPQVSH